MNDQRGCGYGGSMSTSSLRLAFLLGALLAPSSVRADADPVRVLVIGQFLRQLHRLQKILGAPLITSKTPHSDRERLYSA